MKCSTSQGQPFLEQLILLNLEWMLEVEENVDTWTSSADKDWPKSSFHNLCRNAPRSSEALPNAQQGQQTACIIVFLGPGQEDEDDMDDDLVGIGEENLDRMAQQCAEKVSLRVNTTPSLIDLAA